MGFFRMILIDNEDYIDTLLQHSILVESDTEIYLESEIGPTN